MLALLGAWATSAVGGFVIKLAVDALGTWLSQRSSDTAKRDAGRLEVERDQARAGQAATQRELDAAVAAPRTEDEALTRLDKGDA